MSAIPTTPTEQAAEPSIPAQALIGFGRIWHQRVRPVRHGFSYASYFLWLPMRSLRATPSAQLARNRFAALSFYDRDHGDGRDDALAWLDELLHAQRIVDAKGEVWLHTFPRVLGHTFKPVSFWYAHRLDNSLAAIVAEVNNTFGERHCYLLHGPELAWGRPQVASKVFHVSPFCAVRGHYRFRFERDAATASSYGSTLARIDYEDADGPLLHTSVGGQLQALNARSTRQALWGMPLMTLGVVARIHWHALRLWLKRVRFHRQPAPPQDFVTR